MKYRLLGIAPVAPDVNFMDSDNPDLVELFWIFFISFEKKDYDNHKFFQILEQICHSVLVQNIVDKH